MEAGLESQDVLALSAEMITGGPSFPSCPLAAIRLQPLPTVSPEETREGEDRILAPNGEVCIERNFNEMALHLPMHRKVLNSLLLDGASGLKSF